MSDEKKQKEQVPINPWIFRQLEIIEKTKSPTKIKEEIKKLFEGLNAQNLSYLDPETVEFINNMSRFGKDAKQILNSWIPEFAHRYLRKAKPDIIISLWDSWASIRRTKTIADITWIDFFVLHWISLLKSTQIINLCSKRKRDFFELMNWGDGFYNNEGPHLELIGKILEKLGEENDFLSSKGREFRARSQALKTQKELEKNILEPFRKETDNKLKNFDNKIQGVEARFIQIIGIFAAIIAFIVTIVPTAVRLGGASIPIALAGLAIVTAGIILLLAMIFGSKENNKPRQGLTWGLVATIALFVGWFIYTMVLAHQKPTPLISPPEASKVERIYQYQPRVDTVKTIITQPEGK